MENKSFIERMRLSQLLYNLEQAGVKPPTHNKFLEEWAENILRENEFNLNEQQEKEFINYIVYGK